MAKESIALQDAGYDPDTGNYNNAIAQYFKDVGMYYYDILEGLHVDNKAYHSFKYFAGHEGLGIVTRTLHGDCTYPVYGLFEKDNPCPKQIIIDFDPQEIT